MKIIFIPFVVGALFIACGSKSSAPDKGGTSEFLPVENVSKRDTTIDFENGRTITPEGFTATFTGKEQAREWKIVDDNGNKVVAQMAKNEGDYYNLLVLEKYGYGDLTLSVKIKSISGNEDKGGGLVWRYIDNNNYYVARYNPLENNIRFYRVVNGNRKVSEGG